VNEVAAVFTETADGSIPPAYIVLTSRRNKKIKVIKNIDPAVSPLLYPLLFPNGDTGYAHTLKKKDERGSRLTMREYVSNQLQFSSTERFIPLHYAGALAQQYILDMWTRMEYERLDYLRKNQPKLKVAKYKTIMDHLRGDGPEQIREGVGKHIILPSTFPGSPRNMLEHYQDAMAMVAQLGAPDLFITMTINPNDADIRRTLEKQIGKGVQSNNVPHLVTRIAYLKFKKMMDEVRKDGDCRFYGS
jgi:Helitron helicase-like domain at N-terminus